MAKKNKKKIKKAQTTLEILIIFGVLVLGAIFFGIFYFNSVNKNIGGTPEIEDQLSNFEKQIVNSPSTMPGLPDTDDPVPIVNCKESDVIFSPSGGTYFSSITLELSRSGDTVDGCTYEIKYTLDGSDPIESSSLFSSSILITETKTVKARVYGKYNGIINSTGDINSQQYIITPPIIFCDTGSGTPEDPKIICTPKQLNDIRYNPGWHYLQGQDIDLNHDILSQLAYDNPDNEDYNWYFIDPEYGQLGWQPIGDEFGDLFQGVYDGNNYAISNLSFFESGAIFGSAQNAEFKNMNLINFNYGQAGLVAYLENGEISNCHVTGNTEGARGGLAGTINSSNVNNSSFTGSIINPDGSGAGGLVGQVLGDSNISNSYTIIGQISGSNESTYIGGLVGTVYPEGQKIFENCYSSGGTVEGGIFIGGLIGHTDNNVIIKNCYSDNNVTIISTNYTDPEIGGLVSLAGINSQIINSYSTGKVTSPLPNQYAGGLVGHNFGTVTNSYYDRNTSGKSDTGKGIPKTTTQMKQQATFVDWNFTAIWEITPNVTYPRLK